MRKLITGSLMLMATFAACQENGKKQLDVKASVQHSEKDMLDIYKQVKPFAQQPWYEIEFSQDACGYEILINDLPVHRYLMFGSVNQQRIPINDQILGSGKQTITVRLFPPQLSDKQYAETLVPETKFAIKVLKRESSKGETNAKPVFEFVSPTKNNGTTFISSGQKSYEFKAEFEAEVPYVLNGWSTAQDLRKQDQAELLKEALAACEEFRSILLKKDLNAYANLMYDKELELARAYYWAKPEVSKSRWEEMKASVLEQRDILPLKNYKMVLYADGRVLSLQPTDELYKDYLSIIRAQTLDDDISISFFLQKKAGSKHLTPIR
jgi:hypothetical protein